MEQRLLQAKQAPDEEAEIWWSLPSLPALTLRLLMAPVSSIRTVIGVQLRRPS